jgi:hypothetical protein
MDMLEADSGVDTLSFSLQQPLPTDFSTVPPPFRPMSRTAESSFPRKEAPGFMQDDVRLMHVICPISNRWVNLLT